MKLIKNILIVLSVVFGIVLTIGLLLVLTETFQLDFSIDSQGFSNFISHFESLKELFTVTVALLSAYFILYQIENLTVSNSRTKEILENEINNRTLELSSKFYVEIQPLIRETFVYIKNCSDYLLTQEWDFDEFSDESVDKQNHDWEIQFENRIPQILKDKIIEIMNNFESLSAIISNGNIDNELAFKLFGRPYINQIETFYPFIAGNRSNKKNEYEDNYSEIVRLYRNWKQKM